MTFTDSDLDGLKRSDLAEIVDNLGLQVDPSVPHTRQYYKDLIINSQNGTAPTVFPIEDTAEVVEPEPANSNAAFFLEAEIAKRKRALGSHTADASFSAENALADEIAKRCSAQGFATSLGVTDKLSAFEAEVKRRQQAFDQH